jgi:hypothetical protein
MVTCVYSSRKAILIIQLILGAAELLKRDLNSTKQRTKRFYLRKGARFDFLIY